MPAFFSAVVSVVSVYRYPLAFFASLIEGPLAMVGGGMLIRLGEFSFPALYIALVSGDFIADIIWYCVGKYAAEPFIRRFGHFFGVTREVFEKMEGVFRKHDTKILFISKVTMGLGFAVATLMAAGAVRVPLKKFAVLNLLGGFLWVGFLMAVGYFFGHLYSKIAEGFKLAFVVTVAVSVMAVMYGLVSFIRRQYATKVQ